MQPVGEEYTDLYELDLKSSSVRRLTTDGNNGWVTPEFSWGPKSKFLMWTESRVPNGCQYPFPPSPSTYAQSLSELPANLQPPGTDLTPNGQGVAPVKVQQRTEVSVFRRSKKR